MKIALPQTFVLQLQSLPIKRAKAWEWAALVAILLLAGWLRFANLEAIGYGNTYYTAAIKSMLQSWRNFFFVAAEPGGSVSLDKPPLGFWLQAVSAYFLGVNGFAVVLPQLIAGLLSTALIYRLARRSFGAPAGLLAALALAITPIAIAADRNNTIDSLLVLVLLLAAWAFLRAAESGRLRDLLLGAGLVGLGFNIKMLQAFLPLPAFYALYLFSSPGRLWTKITRLALASALLLVVSLAWPAAVDLTPASQRPYVGGSSNNSELDLILGYNGVSRLLGMGAGPGPNRSGFPVPPPNTGGVNGVPGRPAFPPPGMDGGARQGPNGQGQPPGGPMNTGQPGVLRLFSVPLSKEMSWLLPFGILSVLLLAGVPRLRRAQAEQRALVLWGGWLLVGGIFFSVAGFFHEYYLSMLAPPLAALVGIGALMLWRLYVRYSWPAYALLLAGTSATLGFQAYTARAFTDDLWHLPIATAIWLGGAFLLGGTMIPRLPRSSTTYLMQVVGFILIISALLITPTVWSGLTLFNSNNQALPSAYSGRSVDSGPDGSLHVNPTLIAYLQSHTQDMTYLVAVPSSHDGDGYVLSTGRPVLYMGGFNGQDPVVSQQDLARLVASGRLRYVLWSERGGPGAQTGISAWVTAQCKVVTGLEVAGDAPQTNFGPPGGPGGGHNSLYDCAGAQNTDTSVLVQEYSLAIFHQQFSF